MSDFHSVYGLDANPFRLTPDRRFRFLHSAYTKAAECVRRGTRTGAGIVMITGKPGTGKTTLVADLVAELDSAGACSAVLTSTQLDVDDLLRMIAQVYGLNPKATDQTSVAAELDQFLQHQMEARRRIVLIVDEAQNLSIDALAALGILSTLHHDDRPLLEILLLGQEQLLDKLRDPALQPLREQIVATAQLSALAADETRAYIIHRLKQAGWKGKPHFTEDAYALIHVLSRGLPRYVNKLCGRLLVYGSIDGKEMLNAQDVLTVGREMRDELLVPTFDDSDLENDTLNQVPASETGAEPQPNVGAADSAPPPSAAPADLPSAGVPSIARTFQVPRTVTTTAPESSDQTEPTATASEQAPDPTTGRAQTEAAVPDNAKTKRRAGRRLDIAVQAMLVLLILAVVYGGWRYRPALPQAKQSTPSQPHAQTSASGGAGAVDNNTAPPAGPSNDGSSGAQANELPSPAAPAATHRSGGSGATGSVQRTGTTAPVPVPASALATIVPPAPAPARPESQLPQPSNTPPSPAPPTLASAHQGGGTASAHNKSSAAPNHGVDTPPRTQAPAPSDSTANSVPAELSLAALGAKAKAAFEAYCLTIPANGSAYYYYRLMLARAPNNAEARNGLRRIVQRYTWLAQRALANQDYKRASRYIDRGLMVKPDDAQLLDLRHQLKSQHSNTGNSKTPQAASPLFGLTHQNGAAGPPLRGNRTTPWISHS